MKSIDYQGAVKIASVQYGVCEPNSCLNVEFIAAVIRQVAAFACPADRRALLSRSVQLISHRNRSKEIESTVEETLEALVQYGDLIELRNVDSTSSIVYMLAVPSFCCLDDGQALIRGIAKDGVRFWPESALGSLVARRHVRVIRAKAGIDWRAELRQHGLHELSIDEWCKLPERNSWRSHLTNYNNKLSNAENPGQIAAIEVLLTDSNVRYYRGRWSTELPRLGTFVARRSRKHGGRIWCYVQIENHVIVRLLDLPTANSLYRGCDEAWWLQSAIDAENGHNQVYRTITMNEQFTRLDFFSPVPMWATRWLELTSEPYEKDKCLFSYKVPKSLQSQIERFLKERLWLQSTID